MVRTALQVVCVSCGGVHTTLTDSYNAMCSTHIRDFGGGDFPCEWCLIQGCVSCGVLTSGNSKDAKPRQWLNLEKRVCTTCSNAGSQKRDRNNFEPVFKVCHHGLDMYLLDMTEMSFTVLLLRVMQTHP
jgi:hypothetical protein